MRAFYGSFAKPASPTDANSESGFGFRPEALIMWGSINTADGSIIHFVQSIGFSDGINHFSVCGTSEDTAGAVDADRRHALKGITFLDFTQTVIAECDVTFDVDGFTLDWTTNDGNGYVIHYLALEGVVCEVGFFLGAGATGNQDISTTVIPDLRSNKTAILFASVGLNADPPGNSGFIANSYGGALNATDESCISSVDENAANPADNRSYFATNSVYIALSGATDTVGKNADFTDFDGLPSPGFSLNWSVASGSNHRIGYMLLVAKESGSFRFTRSTQPAATGREIFPLMQVPIPFDPVGAILSSASLVADDTVVSGVQMSYGGGSAGDPGGSVWAGCQDNVVANTAQRTDQGKALILKDAIDLSAPDAECELALSTKEVALDWTEVDATARDFWMIVFGNESGDEEPVPVLDFGLRKVPGKMVAY